PATIVVAVSSQAMASPETSPVVHSSPSIIRMCVGWSLAVPKSPLIPASAPAFADIVLVRSNIGYAFDAGTISGTDGVVGVTLSVRSSTIFVGFRVVVSWMLGDRWYLATIEVAGAGVAATSSPAPAATASASDDVTIRNRRCGTTEAPSHQTPDI